MMMDCRGKSGMQMSLTAKARIVERVIAVTAVLNGGSSGGGGAS